MAIISKDNILNRKILLTDIAGNSGKIGVFGDTIVSNRQDYILVQFQYGIPDGTDTSNSNVGGATVSTSNSKAVLSTNGNQNSYIYLQSKDYLRYKPGREAVGFFTAKFSNGESNSSQHIGIFDRHGTSGDGFYVGYNNTTFGVGRIFGSQEYFTPQSEFNGNKLDGTQGIELKPYKLNIFRISYGWLGIAPITFEWFAGRNVGWVPFHQIDLTNQQDDVTILNPILPISAQVWVGSSTSNIKLETASWSGSLLNPKGLSDASPSDRNYSLDNVKASISSTLTNMITIKNLDTFNGNKNHIRAYLTTLSAASDGNKSALLKILKNANVGNLAYTNVSTGSSIMQYSTAANTVTISSSLNEFVIGLAKVEGRIISLNDDGIFVDPGDTLTIAVQTSGAGSNEITSAIRWSEKF